MKAAEGNPLPGETYLLIQSPLRSLLCFVHILITKRPLLKFNILSFLNQDAPLLQLTPHAIFMGPLPVMPITRRTAQELVRVPEKDIFRNIIPCLPGIGSIQLRVTRGTPSGNLFKIRMNQLLSHHLAKLIPYVIRSKANASRYALLQSPATSEEPAVPYALRRLEHAFYLGRLIKGVVSQYAKPLGQPSKHAISQKSLFHDAHV